MHMQRAEQRALPAAKAVKGHGHRDRHVDADHTDLNALAVLASGGAVTGEDGGTIAVFVVVDHGQGVFEAVDAGDRQHRAEDFLAVDAHARRDVVEQRTPDEEAIAGVVDSRLASVHHQLGALVDAGLDIADHLVQVSAGDQRPHVVVRPILDAGADAQRLQPFDQLGAQPLGGLLAHRHRHRDRHAALAGAAVGRAHQRIHRLVEVGIGHHHHVVLGAAQRLNPLAVGRRRGVDVFGDGRRADEADRLHPLIGEQHVHALLVAIDHVEHAVRQAGLLEQLSQAHRRGRILLRWLHHEGVTAGQRHREHPHRYHGREVERRDAGAHAQRLHQREAVDTGADVEGMFALLQVRYAAGEFHHLEPACQLALGVGEHLAVLGGNQPRDLVGVLFHQRLELEQNA